MDRGRIEKEGADLETAKIPRGEGDGPEGRGDTMNWANRLTLSRLLLTIIFVAALNSSWQYGRTLALVVFLIAGISDFIDGEIARRNRIVTDFAVDKVADAGN